jgi:hypothetical protein
MNDDQAQEEFLARELSVLVQDPPAVCGVDVAEAVRVGRRRVRRRRAGVGGIALAVAAAVTVGAFAMPAKSAGPATGKRHPVVDSHDPVTVDASFGWLPPGVQTTTFQTSPKAANSRETVARAGTGNAGSRTPTLLLYVYPKGIDPTAPHESLRPWWTYKAKAPDVNGRAAYWLKSSNPADAAAGAALLRWQAASGRWVELQARNMPAQELPETMLRTAAAVTVEERSVPMPFNLKGIPGLHWFQSSSTLTQQEAGPVLVSSSVGFILLDKTDSSPAYYLTVSPHTGAPPLAITSTFPSMSEQAKRTGGFTQTCTTAHGLDVCLTVLENLTPGNTPPNLAAAGGLTGILNRITLLGTNPQKWTTDVLR